MDRRRDGRDVNLMLEHDEPTEADLEDLAERLGSFGEQLSPSQQAVFRHLLSRAAGQADESTVARDGSGAAGEGEIRALGITERSVSTARHVEPEVAHTRSSIPPPRTFYVMGVPVFQYQVH
jgi:hypothetical protein